MFIGRLLGWIFLLTAFATVSAEAVAALGTGAYVGIATSDILTIITGLTPKNADSWISPLLVCPAWTSIGLTGLALTFFCRKKKYKTSFAPK